MLLIMEKKNRKKDCPVSCARLDEELVLVTEGDADEDDDAAACPV